MVAVWKRTSDDINFFVFISGNEHRPLAPISTLAEEHVNTMDVLPAVQEDREGSQFYLIPDPILFVTEPEIQSKGLRDL